MTYWLCNAGTTLRTQVNDRWPKRDKASDGWIGDTSHAAVVSDHNPCWGCVGDSYGVVRAIDIDADLDPKDLATAQRLANQLIRHARNREPGSGRLSYIIYNRQIASGTYDDKFWTWRPYTGTDPHTSHIHVSFTSRGDLNGRNFPLTIFVNPTVQKLRDALAELSRHIRRLTESRAAKRKRLDDLIR